MPNWTMRCTVRVNVELQLPAARPSAVPWTSSSNPSCHVSKPSATRRRATPTTGQSNQHLQRHQHCVRVREGESINPYRETVEDSKPVSTARMLEHLGIAVAALVPTLATFKVLATAGYSATSAAAVISLVGPSQVLLGTLVTLGPSLLFAAQVQLLLISTIGRKRVVWRVLLGAQVLLVLAIVTTIPLFAGIAIATNVLHWCAYAVERRSSRKKPSLPERVAQVAEPRERKIIEQEIKRSDAMKMRTYVRTMWQLAGMIGVGMIGASVFSDSAFLPSEVVTTVDGSNYVGFVLADDGKFASILLADERSVVRIRSESVDKRVVCRLHSEPQAVGALIFHHNPDYPKCESQP